MTQTTENIPQGSSLEEKIWRVGFDGVFSNIEMPAGSMSSYETSATICSSGYSYQKAKTLTEARSKVETFLHQTYIEPLTSIIYWNTCPLDLKTLPKIEHLDGLTLRE